MLEKKMMNEEMYKSPLLNKVNVANLENDVDMVAI
jgi:hypothetical protein